MEGIFLDQNKTEAVVKANLFEIANPMAWAAAWSTITAIGLAGLLATKQVFILGPIWSIIRRRIDTWMYLFNGPEIIQSKFNNANGEPFEVLAPDNRYVFVSSAKHIKELDTAPDTVLSLQAASKQMLHPVYTMHGFNWFDRRGTEGVGFVRALRTHLTNNLPQILPDLGVIIRSHFKELHATHNVENGTTISLLYPMIVKLVVLTNAVSFFGKDLAKDHQFMKYALDYIEETLICAEVVRLIPKFLVP